VYTKSHSMARAVARQAPAEPGAPYLPEYTTMSHPQEVRRSAPSMADSSLLHICARGFRWPRPRHGSTRTSGRRRRTASRAFCSSRSRRRFADLIPSAALSCKSTEFGQPLIYPTSLSIFSHKRLKSTGFSMNSATGSQLASAILVAEAQGERVVDRRQEHDGQAAETAANRTGDGQNRPCRSRGT